MNEKLLREKREAAGLSREKLARMIDVSHGTIQNWEAGNSSPSVDHAKALSKALDWPIADLLGL